MTYKITKECRINNKSYKVGDVVKEKEVGGYFASVMEKTTEKSDGKKNKNDIGQKSQGKKSLEKMNKKTD